MNIAASLRTAFRALAANKMRSALTVLGIIIGVSAVVSLMSIGRGAQGAVTAQIQGIGTNLIFVRPGFVQEAGVRSALGSAPTLTLADAEALADSVMAPSVAFVAPQVSSRYQVTVSGQNTNTQIVGVTPEFQLVLNYQMAQGEFIDPSHVQGRSMVAVLGSKVAETLFIDSDPIGQVIRINQRSFRVIGVLAGKGGGAMGISDDVVMVPITTAQARLQAQRTAQGQQIQTINVQAVDAKEINSAKEQIADILRERHRITGSDDFTLTSQEDIIGALSQVIGIFTIVLGAIAGISLLVGGIGIMNIMLVSVTERTREIGIRKAVGAKRRDILTQFIIEATTLSLSGGGIGLLLGWGLSRIISRVPINGQMLPTAVSLDIVLLAFGVSTVIGLFFGIYPASRAARLNPIEALRYE
ncbi:MAG: ABC transporter permease [Chloroflexi bacterium]|nr:ABC transporter permease [Chloroflexota bacterium]